MKTAKTWQRFLSMAVCLCMIIGLVPAMADSAAATGEQADLVIQERTYDATDGFVIEKVDETKLTPYTQYLLKLTLDDGTEYSADQGISYDPTVTENIDVISFAEDGIVFDGVVSDSSVGYVSERGYFIATGLGTATLTVSVKKAESVLATGTLNITVVSKDTYKYDFRKIGKVSIRDSYSSRGIGQKTIVSMTSVNDYGNTIAGSDNEINLHSKIANKNYATLGTAPWKYYTNDDASKKVPTDACIGSYQIAYDGDWVQFKIMVPESGNYTINSGLSRWDDIGTSSNSSSGISGLVPTTEQNIYLTPASDVENGGAAAIADKYFIGTELRNGSKNWNVQYQWEGYNLDKGEYYLTYKRRDGESGKVIVLGCIDLIRNGAKTEEKTLSSVAINYPSAEIKIGQSMDVSSLIGKMSDLSVDELTGATVSYKVTNTTAAYTSSTNTNCTNYDNVLGVDSDGRVTGLTEGYGYITVTAKLEGKTATAATRITVTANDDFGTHYAYAVKTGDTYSVITVAGIKGLDYNSVGFEYRIDGSVEDGGTMTSVYESITLDGNTGTAASISATDLGGNASYLFYDTQAGISSTSKVEFRAYAVKNGTKVYGAWAEVVMPAAE